MPYRNIGLGGGPDRTRTSNQIITVSRGNVAGILSQIQAATTGYRFCSFEVRSQGGLDGELHSVLQRQRP
jgi:hypothetical protein